MKTHMSEQINPSQVYEWVKTGHWTKRQFLEWHRKQMIPHHQRYLALAGEMEQMCEFTRELTNQIATSVVVSSDAFDYMGEQNAQEADQNA